MKTYLGEIFNYRLEEDNHNANYIHETESEIIDYAEFGFKIDFNSTREIFEISEMYDWQFN